MKLKKYIKRNFKTQTAFANHLGIHRQQVGTWVKLGYRIIRVKGKLELFGKIRDLPEKEGDE